MRIITKRKREFLYYYLSQSYRENKQLTKFEKYIGKNPPDEVDHENFIIDYFKKRWRGKVEELQRIYTDNISKMPLSLNRKNLRSFGIRFTHNTNKMEGSSLSEQDVKLIVEDNIVPKNSPTDDVLEAEAHMATYEKMVNNHHAVDLNQIRKFHRHIFQSSKPNIAGSFRNGPVFISGSKYIPPVSRFEVDLLLEELISWYEGNENIYNPALLACLFHLRFISIHPFEDGNGRITRLVTNQILFQKQYPMFDLDTKYRKSYYNALENSNVKHDEMYFVSWFFRRYLTFVEKTLKNLGFI